MTYILTSKETVQISDVYGNKFYLKEWAVDHNSLDRENIGRRVEKGEITIREASASALVHRPFKEIASGVFVQTHDFSGNPTGIEERL